MNKLYIKNAVFVEKTNKISEFFEERKLRRIDDFMKLNLYAAAKVLGDIDIKLDDEKDDIGIIITTGRGPVKQTCNFMNSLIEEGHELAAPLAFSSSVHNSIETAISIMLNFRGPCLTISQGASSFKSAVTTATSWLLSKRCKYVLLGASDETHPVVYKEYGHKVFEKESAAYFLLSLEEVGNEFAVDEYVYDEYNPSAQAFKLAKKYVPMLNKKDTKKVVTDFVKTYLAGKKKDILSVFTNQNITDMMKKVTKEDKANIYAGLKTFCSVDTDRHVFIADNIENICYEFLRKNNKISFFTSGSSAVPKYCTHTADMIKEETEGVSFLFKDISRIISTVPSHHSYGFIFSLQVPKFLDLPVSFHAPVPVFEWDKLLKEGDLLVTFPLFLKYLKDLDFKFPPGITVLTSTAPCPDEIIEWAYKNGAKRVIEIYGTSETGAVGFRENANAPFFLLPFWDYAEENSLITTVKRKNTKFEEDLPDIAKIKGERVFSIIERKDHVVQVAGVNVSPAKVENVLKQHPLIKDVVVRLGSERLKAFIVLKDGVNLREAKKQIYKYMDNVFTAHEIPKKITFGDIIPLTPFGKKTNWD